MLLVKQFTGGNIVYGKDLLLLNDLLDGKEDKLILLTQALIIEMLESFLERMKKILTKNDYHVLNLIHSFWDNFYRDESFVKICKNFYDNRPSKKLILKYICERLLKERLDMNRKVFPILTGSFANGKSEKLQIIGEDSLLVRSLMNNTKDDPIIFKPMLICNSLPHIHSDDSGIWDRNKKRLEDLQRNLFGFIPRSTKHLLEVINGSIITPEGK